MFNALIVRPCTTARTTERLHLASPNWRARRRLSNHARRIHRDGVSSFRPRETRLDLLRRPTRPSGCLVASLDHHRKRVVVKTDEEGTIGRRAGR